MPIGPYVVAQYSIYWKFPSAIEREAASVVESEVGRFAWQQDDDSVWMLLDTTPAWGQVNGTGGGGGPITGADVISALGYTPANVANLRDRLTEARSYYVSPTLGDDDLNDGLTDTTPFASIFKAVETIRTIDANGFEITIYLMDGDYDSEYVFVDYPLLSASPVNLTVRGYSGIAANVIIGGIDVVGYGSNVYIESVTMQNMSAREGGQIVHYDVGFTTAFDTHMIANKNGLILSSYYRIEGGSDLCHMDTSKGGHIDIEFAYVEVIDNTSTFGEVFAKAHQLGSINAIEVFYSDAVVATDYLAELNGVIRASPFPGAVAGSTATGGQYVEVPLSP